MTEKQRRFCDAYLANGCNATQAAIEAGYRKKTARSVGSENLTKPDISAYLSEQIRKMHSSKIASADEILSFLSSVAMGEEKETVVASNGKVVEVPVSMQNRMKASDMILRAHGRYNQSLNITGSVPVVITGTDELED